MPDYLNSRYVLDRVFAIYKFNQDHYAEVHDVNLAGDLLEGKPLKWDTLKKIVEAFQKKKQPENKGLFPPNILSIDHERTIWHAPPVKRKLYFSKSLNIPNGKAHIPGLIFISRNGLSVYAYLESDRPTIETKLYYAPFHNINGSGGVCMGSSKRSKGATVAENIIGWEEAFFMSEFTHMGANPLTKGYNLNVIWTDLIKNGGKFPVKALKPIKNGKRNKVLGDIL